MLCVYYRKSVLWDRFDWILPFCARDEWKSSRVGVKKSIFDLMFPPFHHLFTQFLHIFLYLFALLSLWSPVLLAATVTLGLALYWAATSAIVSNLALFSLTVIVLGSSHLLSHTHTHTHTHTNHCFLFPCMNICHTFPFFVVFSHHFILFCPAVVLFQYCEVIKHAGCWEEELCNSPRVNGFFVT